MKVPQARGCLSQLAVLCIAGLGLVYGVAAVMAPWAFHIGGFPTPLLYWSGIGILKGDSGSYPLYVLLYPGSSFSRLHLDGLRPTGGVQGSAQLCTARGKSQYLKLSGTIYNGWWSTADSLMGIRLSEPKYFDVGQKQGFFDLYGRWRGTELIMDERDRPGFRFQFGVKIDHASVTLRRGSLADFEALCAANGPAGR